MNKSLITSDLGIDGSNQIITIQDNGVDFHHSYFVDQQQTVELGVTNNNHRKIIRYDNYSTENSDQIHGTFMAGLISGNPYNHSGINDLYRGIAYNSKLHVVEMNLYNSTENFSEIIQTMKEIDSHVFSNSWILDGIDFGNSSFLNKISFENPEINIVFPAGEDSIVMTPSDANNVLTVGSLSQLNSAKIESKSTILINNKILAKILDVNYSIIKYRKSLEKIPISTEENENGARISDECLETTVSQLIIYNNQSCQPITNKTVLIVNNQTEYESLKTLTEINLSFSLDNSTLNVSNFSASGLTIIGTKKPDIILPGEEIISAKKGIDSLDYNSLTKMSGTSVSVALCSGLISLIRQFFIDGFYPTLEKTSENSISPTSYLIKSILINCAKPLTNNVWNIKSGYGVPNITEGIGFSDFGVRFLDKQKIGKNDHKVYNLTLTKKSKLAVTMCYNDIPYDIESTTYLQLNADLNLVVVLQNGSVYTGNFYSKYQEEMSVNEKVLISSVEPQNITIHVYSNNFMNNDYPDEIDFALSILGGFDTPDIITNPLQLHDINKTVVPGNCSGYEHDKNGFCQCPKNLRGSYCQISVSHLKENTYNSEIDFLVANSWGQISSTTITAKPNQNTYVYFDIPQYCEFNVIFTTRRSGNLYSTLTFSMDKTSTVNNYLRSVTPLQQSTVAFRDMLRFSEGTQYLSISRFDNEEVTFYMTLYIIKMPPPTPTPFPSPTFMPTPVETVYETIKYTNIETPSETIPMTPYVTFDATPYSTLEYTAIESPVPTIHMSPFMTFVETPYDTISMTPLSTPVETIPMTPKKSPISTPEYTPFITADKSPIQTPARTVKIEDDQSSVETQNSDNADSDSAEKLSQKKYTFIFVGIACLFLLVVIGIVCFALYMRHKNNIEYDSETQEVESHELEEYNHDIDAIIQISYDED